MTHIDDLTNVIHRLHGARATHRESVPVKETFQGKTVWEGIVEIFDLHDHPKASTVYAWSNDTGDPEKPHHVTVLHLGPITSAAHAVRAAIVQEFRSLEPAQEA
jgi:hypothetical protein